jgi:hypothetical protein
MTKNLYILVTDAGDGSYYLSYTFNSEWIEKVKDLYHQGKLEWDFPGMDGDGFNYKVLTVPEECTLESLGIRDDIAVGPYENI